MGTPTRKDGDGSPPVLPTTSNPFRLTFGRCSSCGNWDQLTTDKYHECLGCRTRNAITRLREGK